MYGYFDVDGACLKNNERRVFHSYYCRLCYCLWNRGGQPARYLTTYDATVYNLILAIAMEEERPPFFPCERIKTGNKKHFRGDAVGNLIADLSVIGFYIKVRDNETDGDKLKARCAKLLFGRLFKKVLSEHGTVYEEAYKLIQEMDRVQKEGAPIDVVLSKYAEAMEYGFRASFKVEEKYYKCINRIARWILLIDMIDDYDSDKKKGRVNSLLREDADTIQEYFEKYYWEFIPLVRGEMEELKKALDDVYSQKTEWVVVNKILRHSMATLVPNILSGKDVAFHYFSNTCTKNKRMVEEDLIKKRYEKSTINNKSN